MTTKEIVEKIIENARATNNEELENEFEFEATEQGWTEKEIKDAILSPWFPWFKE